MPKHEAPSAGGERQGKTRRKAVSKGFTHSVADQFERKGYRLNSDVSLETKTKPERPETLEDTYNT